jgi:peptidoglycan/LPS O-acetylase OafA/YrhL
MPMKNIFKGDETLKGIAFGLLSLLVLEFGTMSVLAGFDNDHIWQHNNIRYYSLLILNALIAGLLGVSIAKELKKTKRLAYILNLVMFLLIIAGYAYFLWYRLSHGV